MRLHHPWCLSRAELIVAIDRARRTLMECIAEPSLERPKLRDVGSRKGVSTAELRRELSRLRFAVCAFWADDPPLANWDDLTDAWRARQAAKRQVRIKSRRFRRSGKS